MNLRIKTKNHAVDPEMRFLTKSVSKTYGREQPRRHRGSQGYFFIEINTEDNSKYLSKSD